MISHKFKHILIFLLTCIFLYGCISSSQTPSDSSNDLITPPNPPTSSPINTNQPTLTITEDFESPIKPETGSIMEPLVISFYYSDPSGDQNDNAQVFTMDLDGNIGLQLTNPNELGVDYSHPTWSPDCQMIAFTRDFGYYDDKFHENSAIIDNDGNLIAEITTPYQRNGYPSWSPDGHQIAFDAWIGESSQIFIYDLNTELITQITSQGNNRTPDWSPVSEKIIFQSRRVDGYGPSIYIMNTDGTNQREIVPGFWGSDASNFEQPAMDYPSNPKWSPDGSQIAFRVREDYLGNQVTKIYIMDIDDSKFYRLIEGDPHKFDLTDPDFYFIDEFNPLWSPDGKYIFFTRTSDYSDYTHVCYADVNTGNWSCLENHYENIVIQGVDWCHSDQDTANE